MIEETLYHIAFPKLGIHVNINPIALKTNLICIHWYGIIIAFGFVLAYIYINHRAKDFGFLNADVSDMALWASLCGIIGARAYYVLFYPGDFYKLHPEKIIMISEGGIAIYGAAIGGIFGIWLFCKIKHKNFASALDIMSLGLVIGQAIGRWGNFVNQEAFGTPTSLAWGMISENTMENTVHPCFLYESLGCMVCFVIIHFYSKKTNCRAGNVFIMYTALYGLLRAVIEGLRTDSLIIPNTIFRVSQVLAIILFVLGSAILILRHYNAQKTT